MKQVLVKKLYIWILLTLNLLFAFSIGITIPQLETQNGSVFGFVMIPLLIILNYVIIDRFYYITKKPKNREENNVG
ncbi:MAG: archaeosortase H N-terminal-like domain-containing protein [Promethearchaeota archaeon]